VAAVRDNSWVGIDVGKTHHWVCAVDADGKTLLSVKVANDEAGIVSLIAAAAALAQQLTWAVDIIGAPSALLLALLAQASQPVRYASGRVVAAMSAAYVGEGKTDAKDARVIAETARLRRDLAIIDTDTDLVRNLAVLTGHRADLIADRVRMINRLRDLMTSVFPSLERAFDYSSHKGALVLLTAYASPDRIRRIGQTRLAAWLRTRHVRGFAEVAARAIRPRPPPDRRPLGAAPREPNLDSNATPARSGGLTTTLRFPMARHGPILGLGRSLGDVDHVRDAVLALPGFAAGLADCPAGSQTPGQVPFQGAAGLHIQRLVDGFGAHLHLRLIGKLDLQPARDLLRGVLLGQVRFHLATQFQVLNQLARLRSGGALVGQCMRGGGPVAAQPVGVAAQLPRHRRR
jgi:hypothetical protein